MIRRLRLVQLCGALFYLGPLVAGLAGHGTAALPAFAALFLLWNVLMRPQDWPADLDRWRSAPVLAGAAARVLVLAALAALCLGLARGLGAVLGADVAVPMLVPVAISALAILAARSLWNPLEAAQFDAFLDEAMRQIQGLPGLPAAPPDPRVTELLDLADAAPQAEVLSAIEALAAGPMATGRFDALLRALDPVDPPCRALRRGLVDWVTDERRGADRARFVTVSQVWEIVPCDPDLHRHLVQRAQRLLDRRPDLWPTLPTPSELEMAIDTTNPPALNAALLSLARALRAVRPEGDDD